MTNVSDKSSGEDQNTHFTFKNISFFENGAFLSDNVEKYGRPRQAKMTI